MREHLGFLKASSLVVKTAGWVFLLLGIIGATSVALGRVPGVDSWMSVVVLALYTFFFFFCYLIAKIADLLIKIINEIKKEPDA